MLHSVTQLPGIGVTSPGIPDEALRTEDGRWVAGFAGLTLASAYQPIFSPAHRRMVGAEALLRARRPDGTPVSPLEVFGMPRSDTETIYLDRLTRLLNVRNFVDQADAAGWLFLNINPVVVVAGRRHGTFSRELFERCGVSPHRVVIEILESSVQNEADLAEAVGYYRELGCLIAIDDFGTGHSNLERIWRLRPDIVKLDRSLLVQAAQDRDLRLTMPGLVGLLHQAGCLVLAEGVETRAEAEIVMQADVDLVQGYYFARPAAGLPAPGPFDALFATLWSDYKAGIATAIARQREQLGAYMNAVGYASVLLEGGRPLTQAVQGFLALPLSERCYLLDQNGLQIGGNLVAGHAGQALDRRYAPLADPAGADWSRRHYFRRALERPGKIQVTRPYFSITGAKQCITISVSLRQHGQFRVLCGDLTPV